MSLDLEPIGDQPLTGLEPLVAYFRSAERPVSEHRVGLEHEKLIYPRTSIEPVPYEGEHGISALLGRLQKPGVSPFREGKTGPTIALTQGQQTVSLEPGGQLELSGSPVVTAQQAHAENLAHLSDLVSSAHALGQQVVALGYRPFGEVSQMPWMPKTRYQAMRNTLGRRGGLALDMMLMTCTGQVSLDWSDEADCVRKVVLSARIAPLLVALYANSPLVKGRPREGRVDSSRTEATCGPMWTRPVVAICVRCSTGRSPIRPMSNGLWMLRCCSCGGMARTWNRS
jgi:glutamate--cysteine ligase